VHRCRWGGRRRLARGARGSAGGRWEIGPRRPRGQRLRRGLWARRLRGNGRWTCASLDGSRRACTGRLDHGLGGTRLWRGRRTVLDTVLFGRERRSTLLARSRNVEARFGRGRSARTRALSPAPRRRGGPRST
jgi:hypothetical protein